MHFGPDDHVDPHFDPHVEEALLEGRLTSDGVPAHLRQVADLVGALRAPARAGEVAAAEQVVAAVAVEVRAHASIPTTTPRRNTMFRKSLVAKLAVAATGVLGITAAGAAAGALPDAAQAKVASALSDVGVSVPDPAHHDDGGTRADEPKTTATSEVSEPEAGTTPSTEARGETARVPAANGAAQAGLCRAATSGAGADHGNKLDATAFRSLQDVAQAHGESLDDFCKGVLEGRDQSHDTQSSQPEAEHHDQTPAPENTGHHGDNPNNATTPASGGQTSSNDGQHGDNHSGTDSGGSGHSGSDGGGSSGHGGN
jgi:uncharacterized membrane protein YgcG